MCANDACGGSLSSCFQSSQSVSSPRLLLASRASFVASSLAALHALHPLRAGGCGLRAHRLFSRIFAKGSARASCCLVWPQPTPRELSRDLELRSVWCDSRFAWRLSSSEAACLRREPAVVTSGNTEALLVGVGRVCEGRGRQHGIRCVLRRSARCTHRILTRSLGRPRERRSTSH